MNVMFVDVDTLRSLAEAAVLPILDAIFKATLLLAVAGLTTLALRRASAAARHLVWTLALASALVLPALSTALPRWQLPLLPLHQPAPPVSAFGGRDAPALRTDAERDGRPDAASRHAAPTLTDPAAVTAATAANPPASWASLLLILWALGACAIALRLAVGLLAVRWMSRRTERVTEAPWLALARQLALDLGLDSRLAFLRSPRASMPMACGILRPSVLMPADADGWPLDRLRIVLLHELAHVRRRDCLTHAITQLACAVHWFNPLAWIAARRTRVERERACDDLVLAAGTPGHSYAEELLEIARIMRAGRFPVLVGGATLAMAHRSQLEGRLIAILDPNVPRSGVSRLRAAAAVIVAACTVIPLASVQPWIDAEAAVLPSEVAAALEGGGAAQAAPAPTPEPRPQPVARPRPEATAGLTSASMAEAIAEAVSQGVAQGVAAAADAAQTSVDKADPKLVAALSAALKDTDKDVREAAMHALVQLRDPGVFEPLLAALRDASPDIREQAASGLAQLRDRRALTPLIGALKDEHPGVREQAAFALGQLRDPAGLDGLAQALKDQSADVREQAAFALSQIRDRRALTSLAGAIGDADPDVREQAVFALGQLRDPAAIDGLVTALGDTKADVRQQAAFALGQIHDKRAVQPLIGALKDAEADVREQAAFALGQIGDRAAVDALLVALKDASADVREQAAFALGQLRDPRAIDALTSALKDSVASVRQQAAFALGQLAR